MLRVAVCDNDSGDLTLAQQLLRRYFAERSLREYQIYPYASPRSLQAQLIRGETYDLYVLDILMPEIDGIRIGRLVRQQSETVPILYTTSSREYALDAYENHALRYLVKPLRFKELSAAMDFALSVLDSQKQHCYTIKSRSGLVTAAAGDIVLVEEVARAAVYSLADGRTVTSVSIRGTFDSAVAPLPDDPDFLHPHKSFFCQHALYPRAARRRHPDGQRPHGAGAPRQLSAGQPDLSAVSCR